MKRIKILSALVNILSVIREQETLATPELRQAADDLERHIATELNKLMEIN